MTRARIAISYCISWCTSVVEILQVLMGRLLEVETYGRRGDRARSGSKQTLDKTSQDLETSRRSSDGEDRITGPLHPAIDSHVAIASI